MNVLGILLKGSLTGVILFYIIQLQGQPVMPEVLPTSIKPLKSDNDPAQYCIDNFLIDQKGRLIFKTCGVAEQLYAMRLVQFDGHNIWPLSIARDDWSGYMRTSLEGESEQLGLYGFLNRATYQSALYTYDLKTNKIQYTPINGISGGIIEYAPGQFWVLIKEKEAYVIYDWNGVEISEYARIANKNYDYTLDRYIIKEDIPFLMKDNQLWFCDRELPIFSFDIRKKEFRKYGLDAFINLPKDTLDIHQRELAKVGLIEHHGDLYFFHNIRGNDFYVLRKEELSFQPLKLVPDGFTAYRIYKDKLGQLLFIYSKRKDGKGQKGILVDQKGQSWDYSAIVQTLPPIRKIGGKNFLQQAYITTQHGAFLITAGQNTAISKIEDGGFRHLRRNTKGNLIARYGGKLKYINHHFQLNDIEPNTCFDDYLASRSFFHLFNDPQANLWLEYNGELVRFEPNEDGSCEKHTLGFLVGVAQFISPTQIVIIEKDKSQLLLYDLPTRKAIPFEVDGTPLHFPGVVHYLITDGEDILWVATNEGLFKINLPQQQIQQYGESAGFEDHRILVIEKDQQGLIWAGTASRGIHIFDPKQEKVIKVINNANGLSNNTVVNILEDDEGDIWVGTYDGLTLFQPDGAIITSLNTEDGLSHYEFNRYAHYKDPNGLLYFGTVYGLNVINPPLLKKGLRASEASQIYITHLSYYDDKLDQAVSLRNPEEANKTIYLQADQRNLTVNVGMSNYGYSKKNRYAYQLEGINKDWIYIGNDHQINLSNLPAGEYNLIISGIDKNGNWAKEPIILQIKAREFFYKQNWFYIVLALPFLIFGLLWVQRLRKEKEKLENEVDKRTIQIRKDKELIEHQASELKQLDQMKSRFFANISHDFRTPLTLITGPAELLEQDEAVSNFPRIRQSLRAIQQNGKKLLRLVDEMLDLAKIESRQIKLIEEKVHLQSFCNTIYSSFEAAAQLKRIQFQLDYQINSNYHLLTDPRRLEKIINNLLGNAFKFTPEQGTISFRVFSEKEKILFEVEDTGQGIPTEDLPRIFDRFFQSGQENIAKSTGSGIGLALAQDLAKLMGGSIEVKSQLGEGSVFRLILAAKAAQPSIPGTSNISYSLSTPTQYLPNEESSKAQKTSTILIVEDNLEVQAFIEQLLTNHYHVICKNDGLEALHFLNERKDKNKLAVDFILSDINMPRMNGYEFLEAIKRDEQLRKLPVIMLTAKTKERNKLKALRMGVDDYLTKPFSPIELLVRIENLLNNYQQRQQETEQAINIQPEFSSDGNADQQWLKAVEESAILALEKQLELNTNYLADQHAISARQLSRKVKSLTGLSIGRYIQEVKLQKARHLLEERSKHTIAEVAYASGFKSPSHFSQLFAQRFGKSPSQYQ
ncbi:MAG: ATP-binding protein [Chitinophagales bacterium]|nr:ATP-binding protein [Chitinophagales bacterium]